MVNNESPSEPWREINDFEAWDKNLSLLSGHPLQSALWGESRRQIDGHDSLYLMLEKNGAPFAMARVETRKVPVLGKIAWIPRGPARASSEISEKIEVGLRHELRKHGFSMIVTDEYIQADLDSAVHTIWVDLKQGLDALKKRIDKQWMYGVRRAAREGVEVVYSTTSDEISEFYQMCLNISQSKGFELPGSEALMHFLLEENNSSEQEMRLFLAKYNGEIGAGAFVARSGKHAHYFWGASNRELSRQRVGEAVQWAAIEWAVSQGCTRYDLEGIDPVNNPGVYAFKKKMGGIEVVLRGKVASPLNLRGEILNQALKVTGKL